MKCKLLVVTTTSDDPLDQAPGGGATADADTAAAAERIPRSVRWDERTRDAGGRARTPRGGDPDLCCLCQINPRPPKPQGPGRWSQTCNHVWGRDPRGREITCAVFADAREVVEALHPQGLADLDTDALHRLIQTYLERSEALHTYIRGVDDRMTGDLAAARDEVTRAQASEARAYQDTEAMRRQRDAALEAEADALADAARQADEDRRALDAKETERRQYESIARRAVSQRDQAVGRAGRLEKETKERTAELAQAAEDNGALQRELATATSERDQARARVRDITDELNALRTQHTAALEAARHDKETALADATRRAGDDLEALRVELANQQEQALRERDTQHRDELQRYQTETKGLRDRIEALTADNARLKHDDTQWQDELDRVAQRAQLLQQYLTGLRQAVREARRTPPPTTADILQEFDELLGDALEGLL